MSDARHPLRGGASFSLGNRVSRLVWQVVWCGLGMWTPTPLHAWRRFLLVSFGADIARTARVYPWVRVWTPRNVRMAQFATLGPGVNCYSMALIELGEYALVSQGAHICAGTHDIDDPGFLLQARSILIGAGAWVAAEAFVGPGVTIGEGAVLGARGVTVRNLAPWSVHAGNPARFVRMRRQNDIGGSTADA